MRNGRRGGARRCRRYSLGERRVSLRKSCESSRPFKLARGIRVNVVSPPWVSETLEGMAQDPSEGMPAALVAAAYVEGVEGRRNGETLDPRTLS